MSKFDEILNKKAQQPTEKEELQYVDFEGSFDCSVCTGDTDAAKWYPELRLLVWYCVNGHRSYLENFG